MPADVLAAMPLSTLTPDSLLDAVESIGVRPDGRLLDESGAARVGLERRAELSVGVVF